MGDVLEALAWHRCDAPVRLSWRDQGHAWKCWLYGWHVWVGLHPLRDLRGRSRGHRCRLRPSVASSFTQMRMIVTVGWSIYPLGYFFGYLLGAVNDVYLNVIYNIADFVNKIAFVLACWSCAKDDSAKAGALLS